LRRSGERLQRIRADVLLEQRSAALLFLAPSFCFCSPTLLLGPLAAGDGRLLPWPVLGALLLLDAHLNEPPLLLAELTAGRAYWHLCFPSASFQLRAKIGFGSL
jgi:hypothetical protein